MKFEDLSLHKNLLRSVQDAGYEVATAIQEETIPCVLKGRDVVGCAQTGTGKTAAFALPLLQLLSTNEHRKTTGADQRRKRSGNRVIRALLLTPTRELAAQICDALYKYGKYTELRHTVVYGGVKQHSQVSALKRGVDILVATPGRLLDLMGQRHIDLRQIELLVLDEADQMLDMGFIDDLRRIVQTVPANRQTLMFSATMPPEIRKLSQQWLKRPVEVNVSPVASTPARVTQSVYYVEPSDKPTLLAEIIRSAKDPKTLVFSRTRRGADKIAKRLERDGIPAVSIHGEKSQSKRQATIRRFEKKNPPVLVATDVASRGLDFSGVSHVINYDLPEVPEIYVHRIGRTARAGEPGEAVSFCSGDERHRLRLIQRLTGDSIPIRESAMIAKRKNTPKPDVQLQPTEEKKDDQKRDDGKVSRASRPRFKQSGRRKAKAKRKGGSSSGKKPGRLKKFKASRKGTSGAKA